VVEMKGNGGDVGEEDVCASLSGGADVEGSPHLLTHTGLVEPV